MRKFSDHGSFGLYTLKFHLMDLVVEDFPTFGTPPVSEASQFEQYNLNIMHDYRQASCRRDTSTNETVKMVVCRMDWTQTDFRMFFFARRKRSGKMQGLPTAE